MSKEYVFEFNGTKEELLNKLNIFPNNEYSNGRFYYFDAYIVKFVDNKIHFGIERAGHSGGQWFIPTITEYNGKIELKGTIEYIGPESDSATSSKSKLRRLIDKIRECLLYIILSQFILIIYAFLFFRWLFAKILRRSIVELKTTEDKLFDLMENNLGCIRRETI